MKKNGILNHKLSGMIARLGHTDKLVVCDCGFPIPFGSEVVDISLVPGIPKLIDTLKALIDELEIEEVTVANELEDKSNFMFLKVKELFPGLELKKIPHYDFKTLTRESSNMMFLRTGEATPFCNVILQSGVIF
jgi:D-ribose pyranase